MFLPLNQRLRTPSFQIPSPNGFSYYSPSNILYDITRIRPLIEYGDIIRDNCSQYEKDELEKIQNEAARIATGATRLISLSTLSKEIGWESLEMRRTNHKLTLFYKMTHNLAPLYLSSLVPSTVSNISRYNLRNSNNLQTIDVRTSLYYNSFLPSTVRAWNEVPEEVKLSDSVNFYVGKRKAQILHTRLRTNCSSLNLDLFMRNISDTPLCQCGSLENAQHFFFHCRNYDTPRADLLNTVSQYQTPSLSLLLYGNDSFSLETNTVIFETVHKFILDSKRF